MKKIILLVFVFMCIGQIQAQNYTTQETIEYINGIIKNSDKITYSKGYLHCNKTFYTTDNKQRWSTQKININDIGEFNIDSGMGGAGVSVMLQCKNNSICVEYSTNASTKGIYNASWGFFAISVNGYSDAERVINALRYLIEKEKKSSSQNDPFASYAINNNNDVNVYDLRIGMTKNEVVKIINVNLVTEYKEQGYEVYRVKKKEQYFLYFTNGKLSRVDKGVRSPDATIRLQTY